MDRVFFRMIEFAVPNARPGRHPLHVAGPDDRASANTVFMFQRAFDDVRDDLHVAVAVGAEPRPGPDPVLIDNSQRAEAHVTGVVVVAKRKGVTTVQPPQIGRAAFLRASHCDHGQLRDALLRR